MIPWEDGLEHSLHGKKHMPFVYQEVDLIGK